MIATILFVFGLGLGWAIKSLFAPDIRDYCKSPYQTDHYFEDLFLRYHRKNSAKTEHIRALRRKIAKMMKDER